MAESESETSSCSDLVEHEDKQLPEAMKVMIPARTRMRIRNVDTVPAIVTLSNDTVVLVADISGFTAFGESLLESHNDPKVGADELARTVGAIFTVLVDIVHSHAGDVAKFAGDALMCTFHEYTTEDGPATCEYDENGKVRYADATIRAKCCAVSMLNEMERRNNIRETPLNLHCSLAKGGLFEMHLGNILCKTSLLGGAALEAACLGVASSKPGEVLFENKNIAKRFGSSEACASPFFEGKYYVDGLNSAKHKEKYEAATSGMRASTSALSGVERGEGEPYIPESMRSYLYRGGTMSGEMRMRVAIMFVKLPFANYGKSIADSNDMKEINRTFLQLMKVVKQYEGEMRDLLFEDKGCTFIATFGAYKTVSHSGQKALEAAMKLLKYKWAKDPTTIGLSFGTCYAGMMGNEQRQDFVVMGSEVNMAARLCFKKLPGTIRVSDALYQNCIGALRMKTNWTSTLVNLKGQGTARVFLHGVDADGTDMTNAHEKLNVTKTLTPTMSMYGFQLDNGSSPVANRFGFTKSSMKTMCVGRKAEVDALLAECNSHFGNKNPTEAKKIVLIGDPGSGKTLLKTQFCADVHFTCINIEVPWTDATAKYSAFTEFVSRLLRVDEATPPPLRINHLRMHGILQGEVNERESEVARALLRVLDVLVPYELSAKDVFYGEDDEIARSLSGASHGKGLNFACRRSAFSDEVSPAEVGDLLKVLIQSSAEKNKDKMARDKTVIVVDNVRFLGLASWHVLKHLAEVIPASVQIFCSRFPASDAPTHTESLRVIRAGDTEEVLVSNLPKRYMKRIIAQVLGCRLEAISEGVVSFVFYMTSGFPLYATLLVEHMLSMGLIVPPQSKVEGSFELCANATFSNIEKTLFPLSPDLDAAIVERIDSFTQKVTATMKLAALIGFRFTNDWLDRLNQVSSQKKCWRYGGITAPGCRHEE